MAGLTKKTQMLYDTMKENGADVGTPQEFQQWFYAKGEQGYKNRKQVWQLFHDNGADVGKNYEEMRDWLGLHQTSPKKSVQTQKAQQIGSDVFGSPGNTRNKTVVPSGFGQMPTAGETWQDRMRDNEIASLENQPYDNPENPHVQAAKQRAEDLKLERDAKRGAKMKNVYGGLEQQAAINDTFNAIKGDQEAATRIGLPESMRQLQDEKDYASLTDGEMLQNEENIVPFTVNTLGRDENGNPMVNDEGEVITGFTSEEPRVAASDYYTKSAKEEHDKNELRKQTAEKVDEALKALNAGGGHSILEDIGAEEVNYGKSVGTGPTDTEGHSLSGDNFAGLDAYMERAKTRAQYNDLLAAKHLVSEAQGLMSEINKQKNSSEFENFLRNIPKGAADQSIVKGVIDFDDNRRLIAAIQQFEKDKSKLTEEQKLLLDAAAINTMVQSEYLPQMSTWSKAGQTTGGSASLMLEIAAAPLSGLGKQFAKQMTKKIFQASARRAADKGAQYAVSKGAKRAARLATAGAYTGATALRAPLLTGTIGAPRVAADALQRMQGDIQYGYDENGEFHFAGANNQQEAIKAFRDAFVAGSIENFTEMENSMLLGGFKLASQTMPFISRVTDGLRATKLGKIYSAAGRTELGRMVRNVKERTGLHDFLGENLEEIEGGVLNALFVGDNTIQDVFKTDNLVDIGLGVAPMQMFFGAISLGGYSGVARRARRNIKVTDANGAQQFGQEEWDKVKAAIDGSKDVNELKNVLTNVISGGQYSNEAARAAYDYARAREGYKGAVLGEAAAKNLDMEEKLAKRPSNIDVAADGQTVVQKNQNGEVISEEKFEDEEEAKAHVDILKMQRAEQDFQDDLATAIEASEQRRQAVENGTPDDFPLSEDMERYVRTQALNRIIPDSVEIGSPEYEAFVRNMDTPGTAENDILLDMMDSFDPLEDAYESVSIDNDSDRNEIDKAIKTDPVKRTERQQKLVSEFAAHLHMFNFPKGELHPEQSFADGQTQAELDGAGTMEADPEAMLQMKQSMDDAKQALDDAVAQNTDLAAYVNETINSNEPFAPEDVISGMIGRFSDDEIATVADYINAQSKLDGYLDYTNGKMQQYVERETSKRAFKGKLNGAPSGNMVMVTDGENQYFLVNGDVQVGENGEILSAGEAGGIVVVDEEGNIMPMGLDSSLRVEMGATLEEYASSLLQQQQVNTTAQMGFEGEPSPNPSEEGNAATETQPTGNEAEKKGEKDDAYVFESEPNTLNPLRLKQEVFDEAEKANKENADIIKEYQDRMNSESDENKQDAIADELEEKLNLPFHLVVDWGWDGKQYNISIKARTAVENGNGFSSLNGMPTTFKVGDNVSFSHDSRAYFGKVTKVDENGKIVEAVDIDNGRIIVKDGRPLTGNEINGISEAPQETEQEETVSDEKISEMDAALAKIPTRRSENGGEPDYIWEDAPAEDTIDALAAINDGNMDAVSETATMMRKEAESELKKAEKLKTSGKNPIEMAKSRAENRQKAEEAQKRLDYWKAVEEQVKGLIKQAEEAPLRQAEEEDASTRAAIIEEKSDNDAKWKALHQLYDGTIADDGEILDESRPMDINELVAMNMPRNIAWESYTVDGTHVKRGLQDELGSQHTRGIGKNVGTNAFNTFLAKKGTGISIDEAIHQIWESGENELANGEKRFSDQEIRNAVINMFLSAERPSDITNYVVNNRSRLANEKVKQEEEYMREQEANAYADAEAQARGFADADEEADYNEFIAEEIKLQAEYEQRTEEGTAEQMPPVAESAEGGEQSEGGTAESAGTEREVPLSEPGETETEGDTESGTGDNAADGGVHLEGGESTEGVTPTPTLPEGSETTAEGEPSGTVAEEPKKEEKNPSGNKLVTDERYEELKKRMRDKLLGQMNIGVDPEILALGVEMAVYHIEKGARKFAEYAKAMIEDMGDVIRPYLKAFYNGARDLPEMEELSKEMDDYGTVQSFDVANFDKQTPDPIAQAQQIRDEEKVEKDAETAKESLNYDKQDTGTVNVNKKENKKKKKSVSLQEIDLFNQNTENNEQEIRRNNGLQAEPVSSSEGEGQESGEPERVREGGSPEQDRSEQSGLSDTVEETEAEPQPQEKKNQRNNRNERGKDYAPTSATARVNANIAAIELLKRLEEENRDATPEEMAVLKQYSGWGGLGGAFNENSPLYNKVREVLDDAEYDSAAMSVHSAYFTPASVIDRLWDVAAKLGFKGGNILESSAGIGNIIASIPESMNERSDIEMVEIDSISGRILAKLYPDAKVNIKGFEDTKIENGSIDLAITNVPFVTGLKVRDEVDTDLSRQFGNIHDFVIAKNIRKLKEGGIGIFITTSNTLDKSDALREWIDGKGDADVMGVFRLNNATFEGTTVTSDIIVVRKRVNGERHPDAIDVKRATVVREGEYEDSNGKYDWKTGRYETKRTSMKMNAYLSEHPENMGGEMAFAYEKGDTFRPGSYGLYPSADKSQAKMLDAWVSKMKNVFAAVKQQPTEKTEDTEVREGRMFVKDGKIYVSQQGKAVPYSTKKAKVKGKSVEECVKDYVAIRETLGDVLKYQLENEGDEGLKPLLDKLNKAYDNFVKKYGYLHKNVAISFLRDDIEFPDIAALENYSESKDMDGNKIVKTSKSKVFEGRVLRFKTEPKPQSVKDGVLASVQQFGRIDIPWIAAALPTQRTEQDVKAEILREGYGFEDPITRKVEVRYEYLSGNVREKLRQARENNEDGRYDKNIEELEKVVPMDIPAHLIDFQLGSSWVDPKLYEDYVWDKYGCRVKFVNIGGAWNMEVLSGEFDEKNRAGGVFSRLFNITIPASKLVEAAINNRTVKVQRTEKNWDGTKETITDKEASQSCQNRIGEIKDEFTDWAKARMQEDVDMAEKMMRVYNDKFNAMVPKEVDDTFIPEQFEGAASYIHLYPHQSKAVMRAITEPVMLAHQVGAGKTFTLITTAMEMRRLGTAKKPMIVVQNATVGQFVAAAKTLYPNAKILSLTEKDRDAEGRRAFYGKIKYNDWDMIVIPQSTFERIPDSPERQLEFIQEKIDDKMHALDVARQAKADSRLLNQMEKDLEDLENEYSDVALGKEPTKKKGKKKDEEKTKQNVAARAKEQLDRHADDVMYFDEMGIDALLIDEAHEYKRLGFSTTMTRGVKGIDPAGSKKSAGVYLKTRGILKNNGWKNVVFATGTPISNTAAEIWTFMRYLMPREVMEANEIWYFDDFVHNFGKVSQSLEFATNGKFKENTRFAAYINKPELIRIWSTVADTVLAKDMPEVDAKLPSKENGKDQDVFLPQTQSLIGIMKAVRKRLEEFEKMSGAEKRANSSIPLVMYGLAKRAAIDPRLVDEGAVDEPNSKTNKAVGEVVKDLKDTEHYKGTVAIFCDMQNGPGGFNIFQEMKRKLMEQGIPENQIAIITSGMTINAKEKIFEQVNSGDIRVIMGSTQTLGTGVNIQERLHLLIHMDAPDRPMDYTQRNGRILRQGNLHKDWGLPVRILRFGVEDSLDVTSYQRLKTKSGFIDSIMDGKAALQNNQVDRTLEEEEEGLFDNPVAVLSGSQYALKKTQAERELRKWQSKKQQWESDQIYIENTLRRNNGQNRKDEENIKEYDRQIELAKQHFPEGKATTITIKGVETKTQEELDKAITEQVNKPIRERVEAARKDVRFERAIVKIPVKFDDLTITVEAKITRETEYVQGKGVKTTMHTVYAYKIPELGLVEYSPTRGYMKDVIDDIKSDIAAESVTDRKEAARKAIAQRTKDNEMLEARRNPTFKDEDKLNAAREKVAEYTEKMKEEMAEKEAKYAAMDAEEVDIEAIQDNAEEEDDDSGTRLREVEEYTEEEQQIIDDAKNNGTFMKAPNGKRTKLSEKQWVRVRTKAFKKWFGDWENDPANASKIVDENGEPMVVYHGTGSEFYVFDINKNGESSGNQGWFGEGFYFAKWKDSASGYASEASRKTGGPKRIIPVFLNVRNPQVVNIDEREGFKQEEGTDGVIATTTLPKGSPFAKTGERYDGDKFYYEIKVNRPNQIKSSDENVGTYDGRNDDIRFREVGSVFFSNAERAVESIKQEKATPEQWLKMIEKNGGLKAGEDKWMGLSDWLKGQDKKSLTKQEVLDFIRENQIQIEEVNYADQTLGRYDEHWDYLRTWLEENTDNPDAWYNTITENYGYRDGEGFYLNQGVRMPKQVTDMVDRINKSIDKSNPINTTRLSYTTKGLDNKKEIALVVPTVESWNEGDQVHFGDAGNGRAVAWVRFGETEGVPNGVDADRYHDYSRKMKEAISRRDEMVEQLKRYKGGMLTETQKRLEEEEAYIQQLRERYKDVADVKPTRVLVIDEIQSKRHQEGREKGYLTPQRIEDAKNRKDELSKQWKEANDAYMDALEIHKERYSKGDISKEQYNQSVNSPKLLDLGNKAEQLKEEADKAANAYQSLVKGNGIPDAPFEKNWHELAMKRMLRYAAENGYDKVAWTTGEQQAERYDIGRTVQKISSGKWDKWNEDDVETKYITIDTTRGDTLNFEVNRNGIVTKVESEAERFGVKIGSQLSDIVGKDLSKELLLEEPKFIRDNGLRIGGEGMKGFYDQMLPRFMDKYGKKWGVKTGEVELPNVEEAARKMWSVDVTPEMKESVMQGQPLFREGSAATQIPEQGSPTRSLSQPAEKMKEHLTKLSDKIGTKVVFHDDASTITNAKVKEALQRGKKVAGWYDPKDNSVHFYMPNIKDRYEAEKTIWHEVVGHKGMRALLGEEGYRTFMRRLWMDKSEDFEEMHQWVVENYMRYGGNLYETIDEWFAYNVVEPSVPKTMWDKVMLVLSDILRKLGFMTTPNMKDMKYMLWLSRNAIREGDAWTELQRNATLAKLDLESRRRASAYGKDAARARDGFANTPTGDTEREMYRNGLMRKMFAWTEAHQDYMASAKLLMDAILKGRKVLDRFNFYMKENHADSKIKIMEDLYVRDYCKPMEDAINRCVAVIGGKLSEAYEVLEDYMAMKHGLERNREFFVRDWLEEKRKKTPTLDDLDEEAKSEFERAERGIEDAFEDGTIETEEERDTELWNALYTAYKDMLDRIESGFAAAKQQPTDNLAEWLKGLDDYIRQHIDDEYEAGKHDYSGLTAMQPTPAPPEGMGSEYDYDDDAVIGYVMDMESKIGEENVTELWRQKGRMTQFALDIEHEAGLITDKNYEKVSQMFHWYMPLRKWDEDMAEDIWSYMNSKKNTYVGRTLMKAGGRKSRAAMPIGTMFAMGGNAISRAARNEVKKAFAGFVRMYEKPAANNDNDHDNDPLVTELEAWVENLGTEENPDWVYSFPDIPENATADEVREAKNAWAQHMLELMQEGRAMRVRQGDTIPYRFESKKRSRPEHIVEVYEEGQPHFFIVNDNPRAAQAINGQLKPETKHKITAQINRFMSSVFTSYSPTFMARNAFRDAEFASSMLSVKEGWDYCQKFIKNYMKVTNFVGKRPLMFTLFRKFRDGTLDESDKMERYFKEFAENGGITGYVMENNAERWEKEILAGVKEIGENQVVGITKNIIKRFMEGVEHAGEAIENAARFATYVTSRESGRTVTKSVNDAKEVSVNFNRKGAGYKTESLLNEKGEKTANNVWAAKTAQYMRANTLFYNASLQGIMNTVGNAARKPWWFAAKFAIPPMVLGALVPVFNAWVHAMLDDDDDKVSDDPYADLPEYTRRMNMCLYIGHGKFLMIPLSIEHRAFFGLGDIMAGQTYDEKLKNVNKPLAVDAVSQLTAFSPVDYNSREMGIEGVTGWGVGIIVPAYISPLVNAYFNKSWTGSQIQRDDAFGGSNLPEYQKAKDYTNNTLVWASRMWHELWGGNDAIRAGHEQDSKVMEWIGEVSPAKMEYVVEQYFGEPGKLGTGVSDMFSMMFGDKEADLRKIPVVKAFATLPNENTQFRRANIKYQNYRDEFKTVEQDDRQYRSRIEDDPALKLEYENKFKKSKRYKQWRIYHPGKGGEGFKYKKNIEDLQKRINAEDDLVQKRGMQHERNILVQQLVDTLDNIE